MTIVLMVTFWITTTWWYFNFFMGIENPMMLSTTNFALLIGWVLSARLDKIEEKLK